MYYYGKYKKHLLVECDKCGKVIKFDKNDATEKSENNYVTITPIKCKCGNISNNIRSEKPFNVLVEKSNSITSKNAHLVCPTTSSNLINCPNCSSTQISADKKGFGLGKAVIGGVAFGGVGLLGGFIGSRKVEITCLNCGKSFEAGKK